MNKSQDLNLEELIEQVDTFYRQQELETLAIITKENLMLRRKIDRMQQTYDNMVVLMDMTQQALQVLERSISNFQEGQLGAEKEWLAFRGIIVQAARPCKIGFI